MKLPHFPADQNVSKPDGMLTEQFWLFLDSVAKWIRGNQYSVQMVQRTQAQLATLAATLTANDTGLLVEVTDYAHTLRWSGTAWTWGPGDTGSGMMALFEVDPTVGWHLYDGTVGVLYLKADGTTGTVTLPDLITAGADAAYPKAGSPNAGPTAATAPTFSGGSITAAATGISATTSATGSGSVNVLASSFTAVAVAAHTHAVNISDPTHTHTLSAITVGANGEPRNLVRRPWFRQ